MLSPSQPSIGSVWTKIDMDKETAYYELLGIPPIKQPPSHYALLNIPDFESNRLVIENAAQRNINFLQSFFSSPFAELAQEIQKEIAVVRKALCDPTTKKQYDLTIAEVINKESQYSSVLPSNDSLEQTFSLRSVEEIIHDGVMASMVLAEKSNWLIGWNSKKCDIVVDNQFVSSKHCILFLNDGTFEVEDLSSTNGTYVNGVKLEARKRQEVSVSDRITLGQKTIMPWPPIANET